MDKNALKQRYGKSIQIEISLKGHGDDDKAQQTSDLAPTVKDSNEHGVDKGAQSLGEKVGKLHSLEESMESPAEEAMETPLDENEEENHLADMINKQPSHPMMGKSLNGRAKEVMLAKMAHMKAKKGLKV